MKIFLAGTLGLKKYPEELKKSKYILESFYSIKDWQMPFLKKCDMFLLDSGAFTFMNSKKVSVDWQGYIEKYITFINKYDIKYFFELDIDCIVGYDNVLKIRKYIEEKTCKKCIPVWHKSRGKDEFIKICKKYDYVAIGGIVNKEITKNDYKYFPWFIDTAHKYGAKIHGLGFTSNEGIQNYHFDSVDSTTWLVGGKFGNVCVFNNKSMDRMKQQYTKGKRCVKQDDLMIYNFNQWVKFQKYAEKYL